MKLFLISLFSLLFHFQAKASFGEMFGASTINMLNANQMTTHAPNPGNNYYAPALLSTHSDNTYISFSTSLVAHNFDDIDNIVIKNEISHGSGTSEEKGSANVDLKDFHSIIFNMAKPLGPRGVVGVSVFAPMGHLMELNTGPTYLPNYVMYTARYNRTHMHLNYAHQFKESLSGSIGFHSGLQTAASTTFNPSMGGDQNPSSSETKIKVRPSFGLVLSLAKRWSPRHITTFTYQQEMKNKLDVSVDGESLSPSILFESQIQNLLFFDPHIFRVGHTLKVQNFYLTATGEFQLWRNYETPISRIKSPNNSGTITPSGDFEGINAKNIFVPKFSILWKTSPRWSYAAGMIFRQSPLRGDFSGPGNSLDTNSFIFTSGLVHNFSYKKLPLELAVAYQYHLLDSKRVDKTEGLEDGSEGQKIGSGGYNIGGNLHVLSLGLGMKF